MHHPVSRKGIKCRAFVALEAPQRPFNYPSSINAFASFSKMKIFGFAFFAILAAFVTVVNAAPPMPAVVANSDAAVQALWTKASEGVFNNMLPGQFAHLQDDWTRFLTTEGEGVIMDFRE